jgi:hypothetical protein
MSNNDFTLNFLFSNKGDSENSYNLLGALSYYFPDITINNIDFKQLINNIYTSYIQNINFSILCNLVHGTIFYDNLQTVYETTKKSKNMKYCKFFIDTKNNYLYIENNLQKTIEYKYFTEINEENVFIKFSFLYK